MRFQVSGSSPWRHGCLEVRHDTGGKEFQCPECFSVFDPAKVNLHRRLMLSDEVAVELHLLDHFIRCADQGCVALDHLLRGERADRLYQLTIAGVLA
jgi:hypothetical protein